MVILQEIQQTECIVEKETPKPVVRQTNEPSINDAQQTISSFLNTLLDLTLTGENKEKGRQLFSTKSSSKTFYIYFSKRAYEHDVRKQLFTGERNLRILSAFPSHRVMSLGPDSN